MVITKHSLFVEQGYGNLETARIVLQEQYELVAPNVDKEVRRLLFFKKKVPSYSPEGMLVWEDQQGIGRYRVRFCEGVREGFDMVFFEYWMRRQIYDSATFQNDPMKEAIYSVTKAMRGRVEIGESWEHSLEEIAEMMTK